jgi:hypothetical protein
MATALLAVTVCRAVALASCADVPMIAFIPYHADNTLQVSPWSPTLSCRETRSRRPLIAWKPEPTFSHLSMLKGLRE